MKKVICKKNAYPWDIPKEGSEDFTKGKIYEVNVDKEGQWLTIDNDGIPHIIRYEQKDDNGNRYFFQHFLLLID